MKKLIFIILFLFLLLQSSYSKTYQYMTRSGIPYSVKITDSDTDKYWVKWLDEHKGQKLIIKKTIKYRIPELRQYSYHKNINSSAYPVLKEFAKAKCVVIADYLYYHKGKIAFNNRIATIDGTDMVVWLWSKIDMDALYQRRIKSFRDHDYPYDGHY